MIKRFYIFLIALILLNGCEKAFDWTFEEEDIEIPVVESIITNENKIQEVRLSWVRSAPNNNINPITDAVVSVQVGNTTYAFYHDTTEPGLYKSQQAFIGIVDVALKIDVLVGSNLYSGSDIMIPVTPSQKGIFKAVNNSDSIFEIVSAASTFSSSEPAMWILDISWSGLPAYMHLPADSCKARLYYYDLKTLDVSQVFAPEKQRIQFPKGALVVQTKYSLSQEHALFRRSILLETEWRGGLFDVSPGTIYSNIKGGATGFFGTSSVVKMSYFVE